MRTYLIIVVILAGFARPLIAEETVVDWPGDRIIWDKAKALADERVPYSDSAAVAMLDQVLIVRAALAGRTNAIQTFVDSSEVAWTMKDLNRLQVAILFDLDRVEEASEACRVWNVRPWLASSKFRNAECLIPIWERFFTLMREADARGDTTRVRRLEYMKLAVYQNWPSWKTAEKFINGPPPASEPRVSNY